MLAAEVATAVLRRGAPVLVRPATGPVHLVQPVDGMGEGALEHLVRLGGGEPVLALAARRAIALGAGVGHPDGVVAVRGLAGLDLAGLVRLADPTVGTTTPGLRHLHVELAADASCEAAAVRLAKLAALLPAAVLAPLERPAGGLARWAAEHDLPLVPAEEVATLQDLADRTLRPVIEARLPLAHAEETRIVMFRSTVGAVEHFALIVGRPAADQPALVRIHSECFTGDVLGSLRCDCGDQLHGAIEAMGLAGGVLLYLAQEGRGIGLANKLRTYALQDRGLDTIEANEQLGFAPDERFYRPAAEMLRQLGFVHVRLMTNNPDKVAALLRHGIKVAERVPHAFPANRHNHAYLRSKAVRSGHLLPPTGPVDGKPVALVPRAAGTRGPAAGVGLGAAAGPNDAA